MNSPNIKYSGATTLDVRRLRVHCFREVVAYGKFYYSNLTDGGTNRDFGLVVAYERWSLGRFHCK